ncbi:hypothetical protein IKE71_00970 [Candidatus Saccharibacteria bacterium]|nr:hypothetical protein [Candidatus Saccharibacteria bacterium]
MPKRKKNFLGLLGLVFVGALTVFAYFLPASGAYADEASYASDSHTDVIRVTVYDQFPSIKIDSPATDYITTSPTFDLDFTYENSTYVDFTLSYEELDEDGEVIAVHEVPLPRFNPDPSRLDPTFNYDSDSNTVTINLFDPNPEADTPALSYGHYVLTAVSASPIGPSTGDAIEFDYVPVNLVQTGSAETTQNPVADVIYDDGVAKIEVMPVDRNGNALFYEAIVIEIEPDENGDYLAGTKTIVLPFTEHGFPSGDYNLLVTAYSATTVPGEIDPDSGEQGEDTVEYEIISSPRTIYVVSYVQPLAPDVPDTGGLFKNLNLATEDVVITSIVAFVALAAVALLILAKQKKDYRKNLRRK